MIINTIRKNLYKVELSQVEINNIRTQISISDYGIELYDGDNILERDTLWFLLCELNAVNYHSKISLELTEKLKQFLYPKE